MNIITANILRLIKYKGLNMNDYSQYGEGKIINEYFSGQTGTLLSIGENDGKTFSNALGLIEAGWSAHLVEPSPEAFKKMKDLHLLNPKVQCYQFAITEKDGLFDYYDSDAHHGDNVSLLSTLIKSETKRWKGQNFELKKISGLSFNSFIKSAQIENIDLITIDCEGMDYDILKQIDPVKLGVKMLCVEYNSINDDLYINYMTKFKYKVHFKNPCNLIFVKD